MTLKCHYNIYSTEHFHFLGTIKILTNNWYFSETGYLELQGLTYGIRAVQFCIPFLIVDYSHFLGGSEGNS